MAEYRNISMGKVIMGKLSYGRDLLEELTEICIHENINLGKVEAIGAVEKAVTGYYDQQTKEYQFLSMDQPMEILNLTGNVSIKEQKPFVHAHITLADEEGKAFGGHLAPGTIVFACEFILRAGEGPDFIRGMDEKTGLPLWSL